MINHVLDCILPMLAFSRFYDSIFLSRFGFRGTPAVLLTAHPKLGDRHVRLTYLTDWIERKLKDEFKVFFFALFVHFNNKRSRKRLFKNCQNLMGASTEAVFF